MKVPPFNAVLCSENALFREGLARILSEHGINVIFLNKLSSDYASSSSRDGPCLLFIIDANEDFDAAISQIEHFKLSHTNVRIAIIVGRHQLQLAQMILAFRSGANAYLTNFMTADAFIKSIELVMLGEAIFPMPILTYLDQDLDRLHRGSDDHIDDCDKINDNKQHRREKNDRSEKNNAAVREASRDREDDMPRLSARQMTILRYLSEGHSNKVIARKMQIADGTVKVHVKSVLRKIKVENRTQAALWAMRNVSPTSLSHDGESMTNKFQDNKIVIQQEINHNVYENSFHALPSSNEKLADKTQTIPHSIHSKLESLNHADV